MKFLEAFLEGTLTKRTPERAAGRTAVLCTIASLQWIVTSVAAPELLEAAAERTSRAFRVLPGLLSVGLVSIKPIIVIYLVLLTVS